MSNEPFGEYREKRKDRDPNRRRRGNVSSGEDKKKVFDRVREPVA
ncbi:MAG TPA: hypothetical protein PLA74_01535 [Syntrophales bacterium]|nr:hypothetical protein [Syntrophales bacterium]HPQ44288.1 hypothetical protein [Syntrophales bacterium]